MSKIERLSYDSLDEEGKKKVASFTWGERFLPFSRAEQIIKNDGESSFVFKEVEMEGNEIVRVIAEAHLKATITLKGDFRRGRSKEPFHNE
ncbi:MAG: hypothetical protein ACXABY_12985 [Candidatus Thorarchaeota archaeon]